MQVGIQLRRTAKFCRREWTGWSRISNWWTKQNWKVSHVTSSSPVLFSSIYTRLFCYHAPRSSFKIYVFVVDDFYGNEKFKLVEFWWWHSRTLLGNNDNRGFGYYDKNNWVFKQKMPKVTWMVWKHLPLSKRPNDYSEKVTARYSFHLLFI